MPTHSAADHAGVAPERSRSAPAASREPTAATEGAPWWKNRIRALVWSLGASVFAQAGTFTMNLLLARVLGRPVFGAWAAIQNTVGVVSGIAQLSMALTALKYVAQYRDTEPARVGPILGLCSALTTATGLVASVGLLLSAPWLAGTVLRAPELAVPIRIAVLTLFLLTINGYQVGALSGLERFRTLAILGAAQSGLCALVVPALAAPWGVQGAVSGYAAALLVTWYLYRRLLRRELAEAGIRITFRGVGPQLPVLVRFALPATLSGVVGMLGAWLATVVLVRSPGGYGEMAALAVATSFRTAVLFAPTVINRVSGPVLTNLGTRSAGEYRKTFRQTIALTCASAALVALPLSLFPRPLLMLFGRDFTGTGAVVAIMAASGVAEAVATALSQKFISHTMMWPNLVVVSSRSVTLVVTTALLTPRHAALGAAWASLLSFLVHIAVAALVQRAPPRPGPTSRTPSR